MDDVPAAPNVEPIFVRHPRARRYIVRVRDDGAACVTIPRGGSKREAREFVERQRAWIETERQRIEADRAAPREALPVELERELRARAESELAARLRVLAHEHGIGVSRVSVRSQRSRWGSCSRSGHISLNWRLAQMPGWVRDYVMIHELMHLKRMDHSSTFWKLVAKACPEYEAARRWLRDPSKARTVAVGCQDHLTRSLPSCTQVVSPTVTVRSVKKFHRTYPPPTAPPSSLLSPSDKRTTPAP